MNKKNIVLLCVSILIVGIAVLTYKVYCLQTRLTEANQKVVALESKITSLQSIVTYLTTPGNAPVTVSTITPPQTDVDVVDEQMVAPIEMMDVSPSLPPAVKQILPVESTVLPQPINTRSSDEDAVQVSEPAIMQIN